MDEKKRINVNLDHGEAAFFTDNVTVWHNPNKFVIDFIQTSPRFDQIGEKNQQTIAVKHKTMIMDPVLAKVFLNVLKDNVGSYEKKVGRINIPKKKKTKKGKASSSRTSKVSEATSKYIG